QLDSPTKQKAMKGLLDHSQANQANIDAEEAKIRAELEKEIRADRKEKLEMDMAALQKRVSHHGLTEKALQHELDLQRSEYKTLEVGSAQIPLPVQKLRGDEAQLVKLLDVLATQVALLKSEPSAGSRIVQLQPPETP